MTKEELALAAVARLKEAYPDAGCTLDYNEAWKLLVSVRLAAQCTDARVNVVVQELYARFPSVDALANASEDDVERIVRPCGLGRSKARDICACMRMLRDEYGGRVPDDFDKLLQLPEHVVALLGLSFGYPAYKNELNPRLPQAVTVMENNYCEVNPETIADYDARMREYFAARSRNPREDTWINGISGILKRERRPFVREFLQKKGFAVK